VSDDLGASVPASTLTDPHQGLLSEALEYAFRLGFRSTDALLERYPIRQLLANLAGHNRSLFANLFRSLFEKTPATLMSCSVTDAVASIINAARGNLDHFRASFSNAVFALRGDIFVESIVTNDLWLFLVLGEINHEHHDLSDFSGNEEGADALIHFLVARAYASNIITADHLCVKIDAIERIPVEMLRLLVAGSFTNGTPIRADQIVKTIDLRKVPTGILWSMVLLPVINLRRSPSSSSSMRTAKPFFPPFSPPPPRSSPLVLSLPPPASPVASTADDDGDDGDEATKPNIRSRPG
jgi:hypothetical protein